MTVSNRFSQRSRTVRERSNETLHCLDRAEAKSAGYAGTRRGHRREVDVARILIVDDDRSIRRTLEKFLGGEGYDVATAMDAPGAVASTDDSVDLMLLDLGL